MATINLKTEAGRKEALKQLNAECKQQFEKAEIKLSKHAMFDIKDNRLTISLQQTDTGSKYYGQAAFASEVDIRSYANDHFDPREGCDINFGSTGAFNPDDKIAYWRVIHAANCLTNWSKVCQIVDTYCNKYRELRDKIQQETETA